MTQTQEKAYNYCVFSELHNTTIDVNGGIYSRLGYMFSLNGSSEDYGLKAESGYLKLYAGSTTARMVIQDNGYTGIGTLSPACPLHVCGGVQTYYTYYETEKLYSTNNETGLLMVNGGTGGRSYIMCASNSSSSLGAGKFAICDLVKQAPRIVIDSNGNVGIGVNPASNTTSKLTVDGKIAAREIIVITGAWPDYVFKKDYQLKPLAEVEKGIQKDGHLEGIPSNAEAVKNGVALGDMQNKLLQKVEELTLYMIDLKKENEALKERLSRVEQKTSVQQR